MTYIQDLIIWRKALDAYAENNISDAMEQFSLISHYAKVQFNIASIYVQKQEYSNAISFFTKSLQKDSYLAIALHQRAFCFFMLKEFGRAARDYTQCLVCLRDNSFIHYQPLGLSFILYKCEILYNRAMCYIELNQELESDSDIHLAQSLLDTQDQHRIIGTSFKSGFEQLTLFTLPDGIFFTISDSKMKNIEVRPYLQEVTVVDGGNNRDSSVLYPGFIGERLKMRPRSVSLPDCSDVSLLPQSNRLLGKIRIKVTLENETLALLIPSDISLHQLKEKIGFKLNCSSNHMNLIYKGVSIKDDLTLTSLLLQSIETLHLTIELDILGFY